MNGWDERHPNLFVAIGFVAWVTALWFVFEVLLGGSGVFL